MITINNITNVNLWYHKNLALYTLLDAIITNYAYTRVMVEEPDHNLVNILDIWLVNDLL